MKYQVAAPVCALCAFIGALLFGERSAPLFGGYLYDLSGLQVLPDLTLYSMMWPPLVLLAWQALALWWQVPVVHYLGFGGMLDKSHPCLLTCTAQRISKIINAVIHVQSFVLPNAHHF